MADATVLFEAGQAGPPFLEQAGISCEFKVMHHILSIKFHFFIIQCMKPADHLHLCRLILVLAIQ
jgi:hypothetical protein